MHHLFYRNRPLLWLSIILIVLWGLSAFFSLPRLEDPEITPRFAWVTTVYPGASAERVETLVTEVIEDELQNIEAIDEIASNSSLGVSVVSIELQDQVKDVTPVWAEIRSRIEDSLAKLPPDVTKPEFEEGLVKSSALIVGLAWDLETKVNHGILGRTSQSLEEQLQRLPGTSKVDLFGVPEEEILVDLDPLKMSELKLSTASLAQQIRASDAKVSSGNVRGDRIELLLEANTQLDSLSRIKQTPIQTGITGQVITLDNIAQVSKTIRRPSQSLALVNGKPGVILSAMVESQAQVDQWAIAAHQLLNGFEQQLPHGLRLVVIQDQSHYVKQRLQDVISNLLMSSALVVGVGFLLLGWRSALVVGMALPLTVLMVFGWMRALGMPLHQMSMTGLIIALGLLIDNAIIAVDEVQQQMREGATPDQAVSRAVSHLAIPLLASTLTTVLAFVPIATSAGGTGEFIGTIGMTVILALLSSLGLSLTIISALAAILAPQGFRQGLRHSGTFLEVGLSIPIVSRLFYGSLRFLLARPLWGILLALILPFIGFSQFLTLEQQFFPPTNRNQIEVELEMPTSTAIATTQVFAQEAREIILEQSEVDSVQWFIGESAPTFYYNILGRRKNDADYAQGLVTLKHTQTLKATIQSIQQDLEQALPEAQILVKQLEQGPPFGAPIEIQLMGPEIGQLRALGEEMREVLVNTPQVVQTRADLSEVSPKLALNIDEIEAQRVGLTHEAIARQLDANLEGRLGGSFFDASEELSLRFRVGEDSRSQLETIASMPLIGQTTNGATTVPLNAIAQLSLVPDLVMINHKNGERLNVIQGFLEAGAIPDTVLNRFKSRLASTDFQLPVGYRLLYGGEADARTSAVQNLFSTVGLLLVLMISILVLSFNSFLLAGLIGAIAVLSIGLGFFALWSFHSILGFTAILGMLGLIGLAINDSIVVLAALRDHPQARHGSLTDIAEVVFSSTRHVVATTLTTIVSLAPLMLDSTGFWPPLAITIVGGLGGSTLLALYFVPCVYICYAKLLRPSRPLNRQTILEPERVQTYR